MKGEGGQDRVYALRVPSLSISSRYVDVGVDVWCLVSPFCLSTDNSVSPLAKCLGAAPGALGTVYPSTKWLSQGFGHSDRRTWNEGGSVRLSHHTKSNDPRSKLETPSTRLTRLDSARPEHPRERMTHTEQYHDDDVCIGHKPPGRPSHRPSHAAPHGATPSHAERPKRAPCRACSAESGGNNTETRVAREKPPEAGAGRGRSTWDVRISTLR